MKKLIGKLILKLIGWKIVLEGDVNNLNRCILVVAPHTSNQEYLLGNLAYWALDKPLKIIIKDQHTKAWFNAGCNHDVLDGFTDRRNKSDRFQRHRIEIISPKMATDAISFR